MGELLWSSAPDMKMKKHHIKNTERDQTHNKNKTTNSETPRIECIKIDKEGPVCKI